MQSQVNSPIGKDRVRMRPSLADFSLGAQEHEPALVVGYANPPGHAFTTALARLCAVLQEV